MASLVLRDVEEALVRALELRAAASGRSVEEEHVEILRRELLRTTRPGFKDMLLAMPNIGRASDFSRSRSRARHVKL